MPPLKTTYTLLIGVLNSEVPLHVIHEDRYSDPHLLLYLGLVR